MISWLPYQGTSKDRSLIIDARLLDHVNVYKPGVESKLFSIYCDPLFGDRNGKGSEGRFSMIHYRHYTNGQEYFGMVVGLFMYSVSDASIPMQYFLAAVVARVEISSSGNEKHVFPIPRYKFVRTSDRRFQLDQIELKNLIGPLFYVSHGVQGGLINSTKVSSDNRFIIISEDIVKCENRFSYDHYIDSCRLCSASVTKKSVLDLNVFMSITEMLNLKKSLCIESKIANKKKQCKNVVESLEDDVQESDVELNSDSSSAEEENDSSEEF